MFGSCRSLSITQKRFIVFLLIIFQFFLIPKQAKALAGTYTLTTGVVVGAEALADVGTVATVSTIGSIALPIAIAAIGLGVIYHNRYEIANFVTGFTDYMKSRNIDGVKDSGLTQEGKDCLKDYVTNYKDVSYIKKIPLFSNISVPANSIIWTSIGVNVNSNPKAVFELYQTGVTNIGNLGFVFRIDNYDKIYYGGNTVVYDGSLKIGSTYVDETLTCNTVRVGIRNVGSFSTECGVAQLISLLPTTSFTGVTGSYLQPDLSAEGTTYIKPKTDVSYDDLINLPSSEIGTIVDFQSTPFSDTDVDTNPDGDTDGDIDLDTPDEAPEIDFTPLEIATRKFPFCIPWDAWECIKVFDGASIDFFYKFESISYTDSSSGRTIVVIPSFEISFEEYPQIKTLILVFKYLLFLLFCFMLIRNTRGMFMKG